MSVLDPLLDRLQALHHRATRLYAGRPLRERLLLAAASAAVLLMLADQFWLGPLGRDWNGARQRRNAATAALQQLQADAARLGELQHQHQQQLQAELNSLRAHVSQGDLQADAQRQSLVRPTEMLPLLQQLLGRQHGLRVRSLRSLERSVLGEAVAAARPGPAAASAGAGVSPNGAPVIYRHGVELSIEGSYADLLAYLQAIETLPQQLLWGSLQLQVEQHPQVLLTLQLYTLSPDPAWVEL